MPYYESVLIARQEIGGGDAERLGEHYEELLSKEGASVVRREYWGLRRLAYRVRKNRKGHYLMFHVDGPGPAIQELERQLRIDENVVRYLTMRLDRLPEGPSIIMKARAEREERRDQESTRREAERQAADASGGETDAAESEAAESEAGGESDKPEEAEPAPETGAAGSEPEASVAPSGEAEGEEQ
ncbi:MAG: 30S ribosomal protein S6 [Rhodospirillales bacterium]|nr:30S ribosomal protein S6 [Rhodospirillales bacterium]MDE0713142.1 30S ribosomal protein S6 [Rhodospirillales bacterium]